MKSTKALLVIDMLNDFVLKGAPLEVPKARRIIPNIRKWVARAARDHIPVIYVCDKHRKDDPEFNVWPRHAVNGSPGSEIVAELKPRSRDYIVDKTTYSAFFRTKLEKQLKKLATRTIVITGIATESCVLYTAMEACMRGFHVEVPEDCVAGLEEGDHRFALRQITKHLKPYQG